MLQMLWLASCDTDNAPLSSQQLLPPSCTTVSQQAFVATLLVMFPGPCSLLRQSGVALYGASAAPYLCCMFIHKERLPVPLFLV